LQKIEHAKIELDEIIESAVKSLLKSGFCEWISPSSEAVELAFKLRRLGHKDNIENLLCNINKRKSHNSHDGQGSQKVPVKKWLKNQKYPKP